MENKNNTTVLSLSQSQLATNYKNRCLNCDVPLAETDQNLPQLLQGRRDMDPKKLRRVLASRQYSQKYRTKQLQYISQLETEVKALQAEVAITAPRIKYVDRQNALLRVENGSMKRKLSAFADELIFKEAQYEELKSERDVLKNCFVVNQMQVPESFKAKPDGNNNNDYPFMMNMGSNINPSSFNPFIGPPAAGVTQAMTDPFGTRSGQN